MIKQQNKRINDKTKKYYSSYCVTEHFLDVQHNRSKYYTTKDQLSKPMSLKGVTYRNMSGYLQGQK